MSVRCWMRSSKWLTTWPTTPWQHTRMWTPACCAGPSGTTSTACLVSGQSLDTEKAEAVFSCCDITFICNRCCYAQSALLSLFANIAFPCVFRYDDYDYGEINQLLDRSFKIYIKTMVCSPEKTTKRMYESFWRQFQHSEKVRWNP